MRNDKTYLEIKVTFMHVVILLIAVILIGIFLFYIGFNAGKNENIGNKSFYTMMESPGKSDEIRLDTKKKLSKEENRVDKTDIKKELDLYKKTNKNKKKPISIPVKQIRTKTRDKSYSIQVGSFESHLLAKNYARKFSLLGYQTEISQFQTKTILLFRVKIGNFSTFKEADNERLKLEKMEKKKFLTVKLN